MPTLKVHYGCGVILGVDQEERENGFEGGVMYVSIPHSVIDEYKKVRLNHLKTAEDPTTLVPLAALVKKSFKLASLLSYKPFTTLDPTIPSDVKRADKLLQEKFSHTAKRKDDGWKAKALELRENGCVPSVIATKLNVKYETVKSFLARAKRVQSSQT